MTLRFGSFNITFGWGYLRPDAERWNGPYGTSFWHVSGLGLSLWRDTLPPQSVGERGAW